MQIIKYFLHWNKQKINYHIYNKKDKYFRTKEIWWAALGKNIGNEVDGKHELFERPVLIIKKYNKNVCFILPLTSQIKKDMTWYQIHTYYNKSVVNITQGKTISSKRLLRKITTINSSTYKNIIIKFTNQFLREI